jgi:arginine metabolism regulation protein II
MILSFHILILINTCKILTARQSEARCYMLDAERLLRIRGLSKRTISRKARMLHHVYTWLRIVGESTYVLHDYKSWESLIEKTLPQHSRVPKESRSCFSVSRSGHNARLDDFLRLDAVQGDGDTDFDEQKDRETGLMDIHLEDPREDSESLYLQIYGVPETWLTLVSQTTRLANVIDTIKFSGIPKNVNTMESLERRKERLENMVCSFASTSPSKSTSLRSEEVDEETQPQEKPIDCMIRALNAALVIFFYRRVRNVNPWILQVHVDHVIQALQDFDAALAARNLAGPGTVWPAFMAGCEALTEARREKLRRWIEKGFATSGFAAFRVAQETMVDVWNKRDAVAGNKNPPGTSTGKDRGTSITWMDISRERGLWLMLG